MIERARRPEAEDRRIQALDAAMHVIAERGLDATNMRDIAARAEMSPGHILYYFGSKEALLFDVLRWSEADLAQRRRASIERSRTRDGALTRFCEWYLPDSARDPRWHLWLQVHARPPKDELSKAALLDMIQAWIDDLTGIVGSPELAERTCALMDGLALDILLGLPGRTRSRALTITLDTLRIGLPEASA